MYSGGFRAPRLPGQVTHAAEPPCNKHKSPEFYPGNARACPGLEPPMFMYYWMASENYSCTIDLIACGEYLCTFMQIFILEL